MGNLNLGVTSRAARVYVCACCWTVGHDGNDSARTAMQRISSIARRACKCFARPPQRGMHPSARPSCQQQSSGDAPGAFALVNLVSHANYKQQGKPWNINLSDSVCKVVKVYDGDSLTLAWAGHASEICYANCRLHGIDTPELRSRDLREKEVAIQCRDLLRDLVLDDVLCATTQGNTGLDKYGRPLVVLAAHPVHTSARTRDTLLAHGTLNQWILCTLPGCKAYNGGKKEPFSPPPLISST